MRRIFFIILCWLMIGPIAFCFPIESAGAQTVWTVDDDGPADFSTIQAALNAASENDIIHVKAGIYSENIVMRTAVTLEGEARNSILNGNLYAQNSQLGDYKIQNFTIMSGITLDCKIAPVYVIDNTVYGDLHLGGYPADTTVDVVNNTIQGTGISMGDAVQADIYNNTFVSCPEAVSSGTSYINAINNTITNSQTCFSIKSSPSIKIEKNQVENSGTFLNIINDGSSGTILVKNNIVQNCLLGFYFDDPDSYGDSIAANVYNNYFFGLTKVADFSSPTNVNWDAGYPTGGNYWSDYTGVDTNGDGIGETPYIINPNNQDNYPLVLPWSQVFYDSFESGSFDKWDGSRHSYGETIGVSSYQSCIGAFSGRATTNGGGGTEYAYVYKEVSAATCSAFATFYLSSSGIVQNGDSISLLSFRANSNNVATVGWRRVDGVVRWFLQTKDGTSNTFTYSTGSPSLGKYYSVKLYWTEDAQNGQATAEINLVGDYDIEKISLSGNTAAYGDMTELRIGLPTVSYCGRATAYFDCVNVDGQDQDNYQPYLYPLGYSQIVFSDGFESGSFKPWSQVNTYGGSARVISSTGSSELFGARFITSYSGGRAYCFKNINLPLQSENSRLNTFIADFNITSLNFPLSNGRVTLFRAWSGNVEVFAAGIDKTDGVMRWFITRKDGLNSATVYSTFAPILNKWVEVSIEWNPFQYGWSDIGDECGCFMHLNYAGDGSYTVDACTDHTTVYNTITRVDVGLVGTVNCRAATVYADNFEVNTREWE